jgi:hypothetical protein
MFNVGTLCVTGISFDQMFLSFVSKKVMELQQYNRIALLV